MRSYRTSLAVSVVAAGLLFVGASAQDKPPADTKPKVMRPQIGNKLTIEVTGGEKEQPVENASVYVRFVEERTMRKDKKYELNVKTNREGLAHAPDVPEGKVLIQVIAEGWKTFGRWYDLSEPDQKIRIHLEKPKRWY